MVGAISLHPVVYEVHQTHVEGARVCARVFARASLVPLTRGGFLFLAGLRCLGPTSSPHRHRGVCHWLRLPHFPDVVQLLEYVFQKVHGVGLCQQRVVEDTPCAGALPLVAEPFYTNPAAKFPWLGQLALGFICVAVIGIPGVLLLKGDKLRAVQVRHHLNTFTLITCIVFAARCLNFAIR